jgi:hypothetical protein
MTPACGSRRLPHECRTGIDLRYDSTAMAEPKQTERRIMSLTGARADDEAWHSP